MKIPELRTSTYFLLAAFFILLPRVISHYDGVTGRLLVASGQASGVFQEVVAPDPLVGNVFQETVLYVARHTPGSALAFIINRPVDPSSLGFLIPAEWEGIPLYYGGPVGYPRETVFYMHRDGDGLSFSTKLEDGKKPDGIMLGYAGWTIMQLNYEILRKYWGVVDYDPALVFETDSNLIWDKARRKVIENEPQHGRKLL